MIFHITQGLIDKFDIKTVAYLPDEERRPAESYLKLKRWDPLTAWGIKGFNFRGVSCFQMLNFASKLAFFAFNVDEGTPEMFGRIMWEYLGEIYRDDAQMRFALNKYFTENRYTIFTPLKDKPATASLQANERMFTNEEKMSTYIQDGVVQTKKLNLEYNKGYLVARVVGGKTEFIIPADRFKDIVMTRFGKEEA